MVTHGNRLWGGSTAPCMLAAIMTWLTWLVLAVVVTAVAALTGVKPKGTRHVARTRLMGVARVVLVVVAIILAYLVFRAGAGG